MHAKTHLARPSNRLRLARVRHAVPFLTHDPPRTLRVSPVAGALVSFERPSATRTDKSQLGLKIANLDSNVARVLARLKSALPRNPRHV